MNCILTNFTKSSRRVPWQNLIVKKWHNRDAFKEIKKIHSSSNKDDIKTPKTPDLIYIPHVIRWLKSKFRFKYLQKSWDPEFSEGAFIYGSTQAICRITQIISGDNLEQLDGLLTFPAKIKLLSDISRRLTPIQKTIIRIKPADIKILIPIAVNFVTTNGEKKCTVELRVLALKWFEQSNELFRLVLVALQTEFTRDYRKNALPEWIISEFDILECRVLTEASFSR